MIILVKRWALLMGVLIIATGNLTQAATTCTSSIQFSSSGWTNIFDGVATLMKASYTISTPNLSATYKVRTFNKSTTQASTYTTLWSPVSTSSQCTYNPTTRQMSCAIEKSGYSASAGLYKVQIQENSNAPQDCAPEPNFAFCVTNCSGKTCGDNGCNGVCGTCDAGQQCNSSRQCAASCTPNCPSAVTPPAHASCTVTAACIDNNCTPATPCTAWSCEQGYHQDRTTCVANPTPTITTITGGDGKKYIGAGQTMVIKGQNFTNNLKVTFKPLTDGTDLVLTLGNGLTFTATQIIIPANKVPAGNYGLSLSQ